MIGIINRFYLLINRFTFTSLISSTSHLSFEWTRVAHPNGRPHFHRKTQAYLQTGGLKWSGNSLETKQKLWSFKEGKQIQVTAGLILRPTVEKVATKWPTDQPEAEVCLQWVHFSNNYNQQTTSAETEEWWQQPFSGKLQKGWNTALKRGK